MVPKWHAWIAVPIVIVERAQRWLAKDLDRSVAILAGISLAVALVVSEAVR